VVGGYAVLELLLVMPCLRCVVGGYAVLELLLVISLILMFL
jgi:hypothetical protein